MKILILGGSGFIGKEVIRTLSEQENNELIALEHKTPIRVPKVRVLKGSLRNIVEILKAEMPDLIISCARISGGKYKLGRKIVSYRANRFHNKIRNFLCENANVKFVFISGSLMYGSSSDIIKESKKLNPLSFAKEYYFSEKPLVENQLSNVMILRPCWVFGNDSWFKQFYFNVIKNQKIVPQYGEGKNIMSIIHVKDLAALIINYSLNASFGKVYNLFSPIKINGKDFSKSLSNFFSTSVKIYTKAQVIKMYNETIFEAFNSNIDLGTENNEIIKKYNFMYESIEDLFFLEDK